MPALKRLRPRSGSLFSGALYGLISILGMLTPFRVAPGIIVDGRVVVVVLAGVFDGPASGLVAAALVMAFRSWLGGVGTIPGEGAILTASLLGALVHWRWRARVRDFGPKQFLLLGATLAASGMLWTLALPDPLVARRVFRMLAFPVGLGFPVATLLLGTLLSHQLRRREAEEALAKVRQDLEQQVFERTAELSKSNAFLRGEIAERKRAEEAVHASRQLMERTVATLPDAVFVIHADTAEIQECNPAASEIFGHRREEMLGRSTSFLHVDEAALEEFRRHLFRAVEAEGVLKHFDFRMKRKDGTIFLTEHSVLPLEGERGERVGWLSVVRDITERKRAEEEFLRQSAILEAINHMLRETLRCETDEEVARTCLGVAQDLTGSRFGWIGEVNLSGRLDTIAMSDPGWDCCRMPEAQAAPMIRNMEIRGIWSRVLKDGKSLITNDPTTHPDRVGVPSGHPALTAFLGVPLKDAGQTIGMIALANKPSGYKLHDQEAIEALSVALVEALRRKRAEDKLREAEMRYRTLFEQSPAGVLIIDPGTAAVLESNDTAHRQLGYSRDEFVRLGISDFEAIEKPEETSARIENILRTGRDEFETRHRNKQGEIRNVLVTVQAIALSGRPILHCVFRDITERK